MSVFCTQNLTNTPNSSNLNTNDNRRKNFSTKKTAYKKILNNNKSQEDENHIVYFSNNKTHETVLKQENGKKQNFPVRSRPMQTNFSNCSQLAEQLANEPATVLDDTPNTTMKPTISGIELLAFASDAAKSATVQNEIEINPNLTKLSTIPQNAFANNWEVDGNMLNIFIDDCSECSSSSTYSDASSSGFTATDSPLHSISPSTTALTEKENPFKNIENADVDVAKNSNAFKSPITTAAELEAHVLHAAKKCQHLEKHVEFTSEVEMEHAWKKFTFNNTNIVSNVFF